MKYYLNQANYYDFLKKTCYTVLFPMAFACTQKNLSYKSSIDQPEAPEGYELVWHDEFNLTGKPDSEFWSYEEGFVRNFELQYYQAKNANIKKGRLVIEGKREKVKNREYDPEIKNWRKNEPFAKYSSASIHTKGKKAFTYGIFEVRARIDTAMGMWPAIWTLGETQPWPDNGEIDIMEFYRIDGKATILANAAWVGENNKTKYDDAKIPLSHFLEKDPDWSDKYHVWKMEWTEEYIRLYLDEELLNEINLEKTVNPDGFNPLQNPHYILLNLAIGAAGGDPSKTKFPKKYEVDYVRVFQKID